VSASKVVPKSAAGRVFGLDRRRFPPESTEITWKDAEIVATDSSGTPDGQAPALGHHRFHQIRRWKNAP